MKKLIILCLIVFIIIGGVILVDRWVSNEDNPLTQASRMYPLNKSFQYIIITTDFSDSSTSNPPPIVYSIIKPDESSSAANLSYRIIGKSNIDINKFLNKKVYIEGNFYEGKPILINKPKDDLYGVLQNQPVIEIQSIELVK